MMRLPRWLAVLICRVMRGRTAGGSTTGNGTRSSCCLPSRFFTGNGGGGVEGSYWSPILSFSGSSGVISICGDACLVGKRMEIKSAISCIKIERGAPHLKVYRWDMLPERDLLPGHQDWSVLKLRGGYLL